MVTVVTVHHNYTETQTRPKNPDLVRKPKDGNTGSPDVAQTYGIFVGLLCQQGN